MEYDLPKARNIDAAPVEMYWTARMRSFLPRPVQVHGTAFSPYVAYVGPTVAYGVQVNPTEKCAAVHSTTNTCFLRRN
eukprot:scaffold364466_cov31-Attheya_sp.AAC.1